MKRLGENHVTRMLLTMQPQGRFEIEAACIQHGTTTVLEHSIQVARMSLRISRFLPLRLDRRALIRGALLHDYFLYDWHDRKHPRLHGFRHPAIALHNARQDFLLTAIEENIILRHMFPLTPVPPVYAEAWIVCLADKYCAFCETASRFFS